MHTPPSSSGRARPCRANCGWAGETRRLSACVMCFVVVAVPTTAAAAAAAYPRGLCGHHRVSCEVPSNRALCRYAAHSVAEQQAMQADDFPVAMLCVHGRRRKTHRRVAGQRPANANAPTSGRAPQCGVRCRFRHGAAHVSPPPPSPEEREVPEGGGAASAGGMDEAVAWAGMRGQRIFAAPDVRANLDDPLRSGAPAQALSIVGTLAQLSLTGGVRHVFLTAPLKPPPPPLPILAEPPRFVVLVELFLRRPDEELPSAQLQSPSGGEVAVAHAQSAPPNPPPQAGGTGSRGPGAGFQAPPRKERFPPIRAGGGGMGRPAYRSIGG
jgi:hypothetical protein